MSNALPQEQLKALSDLLISTRDQAKTILNHPDNQIILAGVQSSFNKLLNKVNFLAGITHSAHLSNEQFEPIVIGDNLASPLQPAMATAEADRDAYVSRVKALHAQFETLSPQGLLNDYRSNDDLLVLRGVAKLAGVEDYEDAEITEEFIETIQAAIKAKAAEEARQHEIDAQLEEETAVDEASKLSLHTAAKISQQLAEQEDLDDNIEDDGEDIPIPGIDTPAETETTEPATAEAEQPAAPEVDEPAPEEQAAPKSNSNPKPKKGK